MRGTVNDRLEAVLPVEIGSPGGSAISVDLVVDTGFNGHVALSRNPIVALGLPHLASAHATLADGSGAEVDLYLGVVRWEGTTREVIVVLAQGAALAGMSLLEGSRVTIDVISGGSLLTTPLSPLRP